MSKASPAFTGMSDKVLAMGKDKNITLDLNIWSSFSEEISCSSCLLFSSTPYHTVILSAAHDLPDPTCLNDENEKAFTKYVYHRNVTTTYIVLNVFYPPKYSKTINMNTKYRGLLKNPQDE